MAGAYSFFVRTAGVPFICKRDIEFHPLRDLHMASSLSFGNHIYRSISNMEIQQGTDQGIRKGREG